MNLLQIARWALYFTIGRLFDGIVVLVSLAYTPYFIFKVKNKGYDKLELHPIYTLDQILDMGYQDPIRDKYFLNTDDTHTAMLHMGFWDNYPNLGHEGLKLLVRPDGSLYRAWASGVGIDKEAVSGDCLATWVAAYILTKADCKDELRKVTNHYLKNCFGLATVSPRSSNGGISLAEQAWPIGAKWWPFSLGITQPATGPQVFTTAALLALASRELGGLYSVAYRLHYLLSFQWIWQFIPVLYIKNQLWYYTHHVTVMNLWSLGQVRGGYNWGKWWIAEYIAPGNNAQPFVVGWAADSVSPEMLQEAKNVLKCTDRLWPQCAPISQDDLIIGLEPKYKSMMSLAAKMLERL